MNNIFKDQAYRVLLVSLKNEVIEETKRFQSNTIFIQDAANYLREFQSRLIQKTKKYFNSPSQYHKDTKVRIIKTPHGSLSEYLAPRIDKYDDVEKWFAKERLQKNHEMRITELKKQVKNYFQKNSLKEDKDELKDWATNSDTLTLPIHTLDKCRFDAISSQTICNYINETEDISDWVLSVMFLEIARIDTWQYSSSKLLSVECAEGNLYSGGLAWKETEMRLVLPKQRNIDFFDLEFNSHYKIPKQIGIACKEAAKNNLKEIDDLLGITGM